MVTDLGSASYVGPVIDHSPADPANSAPANSDPAPHGQLSGDSASAQDMIQGQSQSQGQGQGSTLRRIRLDLAYDGTDFSGWAEQPGLRTVAGTLTEALRVLFRQPVRIVVAGRTDAGVHATGQVAHIDVPAEGIAALAPRKGVAADDDQPGLTGLRRRLAGLLPQDVRVRRVSLAPDGFDARFSALRRHYRYRIGTADWGVNPLQRNDIYSRTRGPLDVELMNRAAQAMLGLHDFAAYCKPREGATTVRELQRLEVAADGELVTVDVSADAFCHSMVRSLVGVLIGVGEGRLDPSVPAELLAAAQRTSMVHVAPACGLTLLGVDYPADHELAARALETRAVRTHPCPS